jgi:cell division protein ZipA
MNELRVILLLLGIAVIAGVYVWTRFKQRPRQAPSYRRTPVRRSPSDELDAAEIEQELTRMGQLLAEQESDGAGEPGESEQPASQGPDTAAGAAGERLVVVSVVAEAGADFEGEALLKAFQHNKLKFGEHHIYHRLVFRDNRKQPVFSVANLVKPGSFPVQAMASFTTPGVTLFLQLPAPLDAVEAFDDFVKTAERLAVELGGELRDEQHQLLTHQALMQVRDSIAKNRRHSMPRPA